MNLTRSVRQLEILCLGAFVMLASGWAAAADVAKTNEKSGVRTGMYSTYIDTRGHFINDDLRKSYPIPVDDLVPELMDAIDLLSKYSVPAESPPVHRVPHEKIEALTCGKKCAALAVYRPGEGIYLDDSLKPETDIFARSVLLHLLHNLLEIWR